jgi:hypothetical protein
LIVCEVLWNHGYMEPAWYPFAMLSQKRDAKYQRIKLLVSLLLLVIVGLFWTSLPLWLICFCRYWCLGPYYVQFPSRTYPFKCGDTVCSSFSLWLSKDPFIETLCEENNWCTWLYSLTYWCRVWYCWWCPFSLSRWVRSSVVNTLSAVDSKFSK